MKVNLLIPKILFCAILISGWTGLGAEQPSHKDGEVGKEMAQSVQVEGVVEKRRITTYQYGTHILTDGGKTLFALRGDRLTLDEYVGKRVRITGSRIAGYPLGGGPDYLDVKRVEVLNK